MKCQSSLFIKYYLQSKLENLVPEKITLSTWLFYRNFHTLLSCKQINSAVKKRRKIENILRRWFFFRIRFYAVSVLPIPIWYLNIGISASQSDKWLTRTHFCLPPIIAMTNGYLIKWVGMTISNRISTYYCCMAAMYDYKSVSFVHFRNQTLLGIFLWHDIFFWFRLHLVDFQIYIVKKTQIWFSTFSIETKWAK